MQTQGHCPQCIYSPTEFLKVMESVCAILLLLSIYRVIRRYCMLSHRFPFFSRRSGTQDVISSENQQPRLRTGGLAFSIIVTLPTVQFKNRAACDDEHGNSECPICLGRFKEGEWLRLLPNCAHAFHVSCVDKWLRSSSNCPVCRADVLRDDNNLQLSCTGTNSLETLPREEHHQENVFCQHAVELRVLSMQNETHA